MTLPDWKSGDPAQQAAFLAWAVRKLEDGPAPPFLEERMREAQSDYSVRLLLEMWSEPFFKDAQRLMPLLTLSDFFRFRFGRRPARLPSKRGRKGNWKVAAAVYDNARLTEIFRTHYNGKTDRFSEPSRLSILSKRYDLNAEEQGMVQRAIA